MGVDAEHRHVVSAGATRDRGHLRGTLLTVAGVALISPDAALVALIDVDAATLMVWRGVGVGLVLSALVLVLRGPRAFAEVAASGPLGLVAIACLATSQSMWSTALTHTDPSHVLVIVATAPLFGALASRLLIGERIRPATAMALALVAVAIVASAGFGGGGHWTGDLAALAVAVALGVGFTAIRALRLADVAPHLAVSAILVAVVAAALLDVRPVPADSVPALALLVGAVLPAALLLIGTGPRFIPAPEAALILLLEAPLGAMFLWLLASQPPTPQAMVGGGILVATLAVHTVWVTRHPLPGR
mgnify:CR=1 FL=1